MKTFSTVALALSVALGSAFAAASAADAATLKKPAACVATASKPCPAKHVSHLKKKPTNKSASAGSTKAVVKS